ncbi:MAG: hypothetical protein VX603_15420 [Gemmatimonadota bacterium]|nr:hypothetical protein [Gemmatimonadota bacterium]
MTGTLDIRSNDLAEPELRIPLRGRGMMEQTTVQVTPVSVMPRETAATPVTLRTAQSVRGLQFRIRHDTACLHQASFIKNEDLHGISAVFSTHDGLTTVVLFSEDGTWLLAGVHLLGRLRFSVTDDAVAGSILPLIVEQVTAADKLRDGASASGIHSAILIGIEHLTDQGRSASNPSVASDTYSERTYGSVHARYARVRHARYERG